MSYQLSPPTDRLAELNRLIADMPPDNRGRGRPPGPAKTPRGSKRSARLKAAAEHKETLRSPGTKTHTIRAGRKVRDKVGSTMHLYTGLRQKGAQLLMRRPCVKIETITIDQRDDLSIVIFIDGVEIGIDECEALARRDGFPNFHEMMHFWDGRLPFDDHIYHWSFEQK